MRASIEQQINDFDEKRYYKLYSNVLVRIKITHLVAILALIINAIVFTDNFTSQLIQILLAIVVILHDYDDARLKKMLTKNINNLNSSNTVLKSCNLDLEHISKTDFLTQIPNRRYFFDIAKKEFDLAKNNNNILSLLLIDIDYFKNVNDTYGHDIGDEVLKFMTNILKENMRKSDIYARYGGEEFSLILLNTTTEGTKQFSNKLRKKIEESHFKKDDIEINITISIGISVLNDKDKNIDDILKRADIALYDAKANGRNRIEID